MDTCICCTPKRLPRDMWNSAAKQAVAVNPLNYPPLHLIRRVNKKFQLTPEYISVVTTKYWHTSGAHLSVQFLDNPPASVRRKILDNMNFWSTRLNVSFSETSGSGQVRIARQEGDGYWSYLGTDVLSIPLDEPTMNLESFSDDTPDSEYHRVVRHETGHTLGCPHEHMRRELVDRIDPKKALSYFEATQGWSPEEVQQQVLTPLEEASLWGTARADDSSIMCYQIPGSITKDGKPIPGGTDIDESDFSFMEKVYPKPGGAAVPAVAGAKDSDLTVSLRADIQRLQSDKDALTRTVEILASRR